LAFLAFFGWIFKAASSESESTGAYRRLAVSRASRSLARFSWSQMNQFGPQTKRVHYICKSLGGMNWSDACLSEWWEKWTKTKTLKVRGFAPCNVCTDKSVSVLWDETFCPEIFVLKFECCKT
jgi:hypothetical protein